MKRLLLLLAVLALAWPVAAQDPARWPDKSSGSTTPSVTGATLTESGANRIVGGQVRQFVSGYDDLPVLYVSPTAAGDLPAGNDTNTGSRFAPLASLDAAFAAARGAIGHDAPLHVILDAGEDCTIANACINGGNTSCTGLDTPHDCCTGAGTGTCTETGLNVDGDAYDRGDKFHFLLSGFDGKRATVDCENADMADDNALAGILTNVSDEATAGWVGVQNVDFVNCDGQDIIRGEDKGKFALLNSYMTAQGEKVGGTNNCATSHGDEDSASLLLNVDCQIQDDANAAENGQAIAFATANPALVIGGTFDNADAATAGTATSLRATGEADIFAYGLNVVKTGAAFGPHVWVSVTSAAVDSTASIACHRCLITGFTGTDVTGVAARLDDARDHNAIDHAVEISGIGDGETGIITLYDTTIANVNRGIGAEVTAGSTTASLQVTTRCLHTDQLDIQNLVGPIFGNLNEYYFATYDSTSTDLLTVDMQGSWDDHNGGGNAEYFNISGTEFDDNGATHGDSADLAMAQCVTDTGTCNLFDDLTGTAITGVDQASAIGTLSAICNPGGQCFPFGGSAPALDMLLCNDDVRPCHPDTMGCDLTFTEDLPFTVPAFVFGAAFNKITFGGGSMGK